MGSIGTPITEVIPAVGTPGPTYATEIDDFLTEVKTRLEAKIPFTSILGSGGALDSNNQGIRNVNYLGLYALTSPPTALSTSNLSISTYNGDLYWVTTAGVLQVTSGTTLNSAGIGGIGGDYGGANPARENFVDSTSTYEFYDDFAGLVWAYTKSLGHYFTSTVNNAFAAHLTFTGTASTSYILPTAPPGSNNSAVSLSSSGAFSTGTITNDIVLGGATKIQHGNRSVQFDFASSAYATAGIGLVSGIHVVVPNATGGYALGGAAGDYPVSLYISLPGPTVGARIQSVVLNHKKFTTDVTTFRVWKKVGNTVTALGTAVTDNAASQHDTTITIGGGYVAVAGESYYLKIDHPRINDEVYTVYLTYDQPA